MATLVGYLCIAFGLANMAIGFALFSGTGFLLIVLGTVMCAIGIKELVDLDRYEEN